MVKQAPKGRGAVSPEGATDVSPAFQRRESRRRVRSPVGTTDGRHDFSRAVSMGTFSPTDENRVSHVSRNFSPRCVSQSSCQRRSRFPQRKPSLQLVRFLSHSFSRFAQMNTGPRAREKNAAFFSRVRLTRNQPLLRPFVFFLSRVSPLLSFSIRGRAITLLLSFSIQKNSS